MVFSCDFFKKLVRAASERYLRLSVSRVRAAWTPRSHVWSRSSAKPRLGTVQQEQSHAVIRPEAARLASGRPLMRVTAILRTKWSVVGISIIHGGGSWPASRS